MNQDLKVFVQEKKYFTKNEPVVVALSGGVDSMVLFHILHSLNSNVIIAHVNHGKRDASFDEYEELKDIAYHKNVPFEGKQLKNVDGNFHDESRNQRFEFFIDVAKKHNAKKVFLAHHADDQIETILMRMTRGSSFTGYAGIKEVREFEGISIVRPFMQIGKEQIVEYAKRNCISYFEDTSNKEDDYTRNRFRHHVVPALKKENEALIQKVLQYSDYLSMADEYLIQKRNEFFERYIQNGVVDLDEFKKEKQILRIKILKQLVNDKSKDTIEVTYQQYMDMIDLLLSKTPNVSYDLKSGFTLIKVYNQFYIGKDIENIDVNLEIKGFGEYSISHKGKYIFSKEKLNINCTDYFELCYNETVFPLYLRNRQDGDKMRLAVGTKKVKDILIDQKIPKIDRENLILLSNKENVLWIPRIKKSKQHRSDSNKLFIYEVI